MLGIDPVLLSLLLNQWPVEQMLQPVVDSIAVRNMIEHLYD